jgi:hypothetical protein
MSDNMGDNTAIAKAKDKESVGSKGQRGPKPSFNMSELRQLADLVNEHGFTDFEFENENIRVRLSKALQPAAPATVSHPAPVTATAAPAQ